MLPRSEQIRTSLYRSSQWASSRRSCSHDQRIVSIHLWPTRLSLRWYRVSPLVRHSTRVLMIDITASASAPRLSTATIPSRSHLIAIHPAEVMPLRCVVDQIESPLGVSAMPEDQPPCPSQSQPQPRLPSLLHLPQRRLRPLPLEWAGNTWDVSPIKPEVSEHSIKG